MKGDLDMSYNHDKVLSGMVCEKDLNKIKEAVCIQVEKIYDSCKEKDCIEDARVLFKDPDKVQWIINHAINVKARNAEVVRVFSDVESVPFKRGFFTVDVKFFIKILLEFFVPKSRGGIKIIPVPGLVLFDKKVILFGSEGNVKIFRTHFEDHAMDKPSDSALEQDNLPISKVEVADPIALNAKICELVEKCCNDNCCDKHVPRSIAETLEDVEINESEFEDVSDEERHIIDRKVVLVTIGLFSIIKLARFVQLLIPAFDFCVPNKKCIASTNEDPCELFETIEFPIDEFFPPQKCDFPGAEDEERSMSKEE